MPPNRLLEHHQLDHWPAGCVPKIEPKQYRSGQPHHSRNGHSSNEPIDRKKTARNRNKKPKKREKMKKKTEKNHFKETKTDSSFVGCFMPYAFYPIILRKFCDARVWHHTKPIPSTGRCDFVWCVKFNSTVVAEWAKRHTTARRHHHKGQMEQANTAKHSTTQRTEQSKGKDDDAQRQSDAKQPVCRRRRRRTKTTTTATPIVEWKEFVMPVYCCCLCVSVLVASFWVGVISC